ncbi:MAG: UDP-N-acetylglucosamine--N-acetylmuramyl-(pentapeptide) pyrophosphoryl-undecaprenol N-acetylglucosamine transferase [Gammaproteobacteria bacterium]|nr:UDP-N-acetylglucosamine--N-acetylmuramyl-(pentapeptide) pyrophosphoryl-undecaprenol N-acetylglucosamine transferase [Gammaproteobacteria bacterium]
MSKLPVVLFFNINGSGMGHMNRCLSYARRLQKKVEPVFFSLASAVEIIEEMGFEADYFVSPNWSDNSTYVWNSELAIRLGVMLERVRPSVIVFDGTWPYQGFLSACKAYGSAKLVWSKRGLMKQAAAKLPVPENIFDLVLVPGEIGSSYKEVLLEDGTRRIHLAPVSLLDNEEILERNEARKALRLEGNDRYVLFSLGAGNINDISGVGSSLIQLFEAAGYRVVWMLAQISVQDAQLPPNVIPLSVYPLVRYMRAFDVFVGAAGYNTCCEVVQVGIPSFLVPNEQTGADDQARRASIAARHAPVVVSSCKSESERLEAVERLLAFVEHGTDRNIEPISMSGASMAADEIVAVANVRR